jgi:hypothetical protein
MVIVNLAVWESIEALEAYVYGGVHLEMLRRRREWFERLVEPYVVLWWVEAGHRPSTAEAEARLLHLRAHGPSEHAFTLRRRF